MMNPEIKTKLLVALRSGEYQQGHRTLRPSKGEHYCCLAVLADVCGEKWTEDRSGRLQVNLPDGATRAAPSPSHSTYFGGASELTYKEAQTLASMNDNERASFLEIANYIEATL